MEFLSKLKKINNQTLPSITKCEQGNTWWASFEFYPEMVGSRKSVFRGYMYTGESYWSQKECVVKFDNSNLTTDEDFQQFVEGCREVSLMAGKFNATHNDYKIEVLIPCVSVMDEVAFYNGMFRYLKGYDRVIKDSDCVLLEERLDGQFVNFTDSFGKPYDQCPAILNEFVHFCYHESKGNIGVSNLQGIWKNNKIMLSSPVVHSTDSKFGPEDNGSKGVNEVFRHHKCNAVCRSYISCLGPVIMPSAPPTNPDKILTDKQNSEHQKPEQTDFSDAPPPYPFGEVIKCKDSVMEKPAVHMSCVIPT